MKKIQENQDIFAWNIGIFGYTFLVGEIPHFGLGFIPKFMIFPLFWNPWETSQQFPWKQCPSFQSLPLFPPSQKWKFMEIQSFSLKKTKENILEIRDLSH